MAFARHAADVLSGLDAAIREAGALRQHITGWVAIGAIPAAATALAPRALAQLTDEHPQVTVGFVEDSPPGLLRQLRSNRLDLAVVGVCAGPQEHDLDGLRQETLLEDDLRVALPRHHPLATRPLLRADELRHDSWIVETAAGDTPYYGPGPPLFGQLSPIGRANGPPAWEWWLPAWGSVCCRVWRSPPLQPA
ncbi:LysR substrate-binding domain-containing protein [Streptomyces sp. B15]|uniref:LysR substrate-binding domain-containing protein n=1 Tax=Streptomyces sp. B15 TaxID=1537797 RepID=UPI001B367A3A|nr:LysR substrate-binding domain-containing protein [Streptomyces sp. B15]